MLILKNTKDVLEARTSTYHTAVTLQNAFMHVGMRSSVWPCSASSGTGIHWRTARASRLNPLPLLGLNEDLKVSKFEFASNARPSLFAYPPPAIPPVSIFSDMLLAIIGAEFTFFYLFCLPC
ncbi:hypothetical protein BDR05DRAFT_739063 [Suillus weaverae]|nr:hypothetical protein BDR05DRAFT_739063 [Suillus weaverae]